jgi:hypothetical protein
LEFCARPKKSTAFFICRKFENYDALNEDNEENRGVYVADERGLQKLAALKDEICRRLSENARDYSAGSRTEKSR